MLGGLLLLGTAGAPTPRRAGAAALAFLAGLLGKESAGTYPLLAVLWIVRFDLWRSTSRRERALLTAALLVPLIVYLPLRYVALDGQLIRPQVRDLVNNPLVGMDGWRRGAGLLTVFGHYLRLLVAPRTLSCDYGLAVIDPNRMPDAMTSVGLVGVLALAGLLIAGLRPDRRTRTTPRLRNLALLTAMFLAAYAPASNILLLNVSVGERLIYLPSVFFLAAAGGIIAGLTRRVAQDRPRDARATGRQGGAHASSIGPPGPTRSPATQPPRAQRSNAPTLDPGSTPAHRNHARLRLTAAVLVGLLLALAARSLTRQFDWRSNRTLFLTDVRTFPQSLRLNAICGELLRREALAAPDPAARRLLLAEAQRYLEAAMRINARDAETLKYLALVLEARGRGEQARLLFERALALNPTDPALIAGLRRTSATITAVQRADLVALQQRLATRPADAVLRARLARALLDAGRPAEALHTLEQAPQALHDNPRLLSLRAEALLMLMRDEQAARLYQRLVRIEPDNWQAHTNLARLLADHNPRAALEHARIAARLRPDDLRVQINLAEALRINDQRAEALRVYRRLLERIPPSDPLHAAVADRIEELSKRP